MTTPTQQKESLGLVAVLLIVAVAVAVLVTGGTALWSAVVAGFGAPILGILAVLIGRRVSRTRVGTRDDGKPIWSRVKVLDLARHIQAQHFAGMPIGRWASTVAGATVVAALIPWRAFLPIQIGGAVALTAATVGCIAGVVLISCAVAVGRRYRRQVRSNLAERGRYSAALQFVCGVNDVAWERAQWELDGTFRSIIVRAPHEAVAGALRNADRVAQALPGWVVDPDRSGSTAVLREMTEDEHRRARIAEVSEGLVVDAGQPDADGRTELALAPGISPAKAEAVEAFLQRTGDLSLVEWQPLHRRAVAARLSDDDREMRSRVATLLGVYAHEVGVTVERDDEGIRELTVQAPAGRAADGETRVAQMRRVMLQAVPGAHRDWSVDVDPVSDRVNIERRARRALPARVALPDLLPATFSPDDWATIPVGLDPDGRAFGQDLTTAPMSAVAGPTGSGKTVLLLADAAQRLVRGHDLVVIDPTKGGVDFASLEPYTLAFAREYDEAVAAIQAAYAEGQRRRAILLREGAVKWSDLPAAVREAEGIRPLTILIDEAASLLIAPHVPKGLPKNHPEVVAATELGAQKALLSLFIGRTARELRFVGVHLVLAMQRPDASILGGEVRSNLSHRVQLVAPSKHIGRTELDMLFPPPIVGEVFDTIARFDDGRSRGLAVLAGDEASVAAVRVAYTPVSEIPALLAERGIDPVPAERRLDLHPSTADAVTGEDDDLFA